MKNYFVNQSKLTADCWMVQIMGLKVCETCEFLNTLQCGGKKFREQLLKGTKSPIGKEI